MPSYNDRSIDEALPGWLAQNYPRYDIVVAEDEGKRYGSPARVEGYEYIRPDGKVQRVVVEEHVVNEVHVGRLVVVRRGSRDGFKPGALNNVIHLVETRALRDLAGIEEPDYVMVVDADHEPSRNPFLRLIVAGKLGLKLRLENKPLDPKVYNKLGKTLRGYEEAGRELLGLDSYRLDPRLMDSPESLVTRAVELMEYHRRLLPSLAVVQGYQNHYPSSRTLD